jgi:hypothetical protein
MTGSKVEFLPFSAINMFMRPDYRLEVVRKVFNIMHESPEDVRATFNRYIKKYITVPGFRNSSAAPAALKVKPYISAFESQAEVAAFTLAAWARVNSSLVDKVFDLLIARGWELLPKDADRTKLPGFLTTWPKDENFEAINQAFKEKYREEAYNEDDISLMAVWLSGRLPYQEADPTKE